MILKLEGANRMRNAFNRIFLSMRIVIGGVDNPLIARLMVCYSADAVKRWVSQIDVWRRHINLGAKHPGSILKLPRFHCGEQGMILVDRPIPVRAVFTGRGQCTSVVACLISAQVTDVSLAFIN